MNELCRQQSERKIGDLPVLLWAIGGCLQLFQFTDSLAILSTGYGYSLFHCIGIPTFAKLMAPNKIIKKRVCVYFGVMCVHYIICAYMLFT